MVPGSLRGLHLIVPDLEAARAEVVGRGVDASEPFHFDAGGQPTGLAPDRRSYESFVSFQRPRWQHLARPGSRQRD